MGKLIFWLINIGLIISSGGLWLLALFGIWFIKKLFGI